MAKQKTQRRKGNARSSDGKGRVVGRVVLWAVMIVLTAGVMGAAGVGLRKLLFTDNPHFTLREIRVEAAEDGADESVRPILEAHGAVPGEITLFQLNLTDIRAALENNVTVARAHVARQLPDALVVRIFERRPVGLLRCGVLRAIDADGVVLPWTDPGTQVMLPEITGIRNPDALVPGEVPDDPALLGALRLLKEFATRPEGVQYDVATIQLDYYLPSLRVHLRERGTFRDGSIIIVPVEKMGSALDRLREIVALRSDGRQSTSYVDVTYEINVPARP